MRTVPSLLLALAAAALPLAGHAAETVFAFTGQVKYSALDGVAVGDMVTGTFRYDPAATSFSGQPGSHESYSFSDPSWGIFQAEVGGHHISASNLYVDVFNDQNGNTEDMAVIRGGYKLKVDDTVYDNGSMGVWLSSQPGNTGVLDGTSLPLSYDVASFDAYPGLTYGYAQMDGGQGGSLFSFTPLSIVATVPEAGGMQMSLLGMLGLAGVMLARGRRA